MSETFDFSSLNLTIDPSITTLPIERQREIYEYLNQLDNNHKKAYQIAYEHLGTSFDVVRSNGFKSWLSVLKFLNDSDEDIKELFDYKNNYKFNYNNVSESSQYKSWLKKK